MYQNPPPISPSGRCPQCQGQGVVSCYSCNGTGRCTASYYHTDFFGGKSVYYCDNGKCPRCQGSGEEGAWLVFNDKCPMCNGSGYCTACSGTGKCATCKGTGKITCQACGGRR